jgi:hypothetical protein
MCNQIGFLNKQSAIPKNRSAVTGRKAKDFSTKMSAGFPQQIQYQ